MKNINLNFFIPKVIILAFISWFALLFIYQGNFNIRYESIFRISTVLSINGFYWLAFSKWLWKWPLWHIGDWLVTIPSLDGLWEGNIISEYIDPKTKKKVISKKVSLRIKQELFSISIITKTDLMESRSISAGFVISQEHKTKKLVYTYFSTPDTAFRKVSPIHLGTTMLDITGKNSDKLNGEYWTSRGTVGKLVKLKRILKIKK